MLIVEIQPPDKFDDDSQSFITDEVIKVKLEHSLVSVSKWESKWEKPFLDSKQKSVEETYDYISMMMLDEESPEEILPKFEQEHIDQITQYIASKQTATWFREEKKSGTTEIVTAEVLYHNMIALNIPMECQYWHINRLLTLIRVVNEKNTPPKKMSRAQLAARNRELNAKRMQELGTRG